MTFALVFDSCFTHTQTEKEMANCKRPSPLFSNNRRKVTEEEKRKIKFGKDA